MAKILLLPDSFKGSASSSEVATAISRGWSAVRPEDQLTAIAFADGGEGTLVAIESAVNDAVRVPVIAQSGDGREHECYWLLVNGDTAVIEMAMICGITTVEKLDALGAHSYGLGQVIAAASADPRINEILIAVGGSGSTDAAVGALMALGFECVDGSGARIELGGRGLPDLVQLRGEYHPPIRGVKILVDVQSPMTGLSGAAHIFAPQKGATATEVEYLDHGLRNFLNVVSADDAPGYGAAGGVSGGLALVLGAQIVSGVAAIAELSDVAKKIASADLLLTGEGAFDEQSFQGKVVGYLLNEAARSQTRAMVVCGINKNGADNDVISLVELAPSAEEAMGEAEKWLIAAGSALAERFDAASEM